MYAHRTRLAACTRPPDIHLLIDPCKFQLGCMHGHARQLHSLICTAHMRITQAKLPLPKAKLLEAQMALTHPSPVSGSLYRHLLARSDYCLHLHHLLLCQFPEHCAPETQSQAVARSCKTTYTVSSKVSAVMPWQACAGPSPPSPFSYHECGCCCCC